MTANGRHGQVVGLLLGDGSVRLVKYSIDPRVWKGLATIARREVGSDEVILTVAQEILWSSSGFHLRAIRPWLPRHVEE
jgi:hypothetical protein